MLYPFRAMRLSDAIKNLQEKHIEYMSAGIIEVRQMLADHPCPDTFLGRKTQEPFPREDDL